MCLPLNASGIDYLSWEPTPTMMFLPLAAFQIYSVPAYKLQVLSISLVKDENRNTRQSFICWCCQVHSIMRACKGLFCNNARVNCSAYYSYLASCSLLLPSVCCGHCSVGDFLDAHDILCSFPTEVCSHRSVSTESVTVPDQCLVLPVHYLIQNSIFICVLFVFYNDCLAQNLWFRLVLFD